MEPLKPNGDNLATERGGERRVADQVLELCELDRRLIGYEIHDGFAQHAGASLLLFQRFREELPQNARDARATFDKAMEFLRESAFEARRLINGQCTTIVEESGLKAAIEELISEVQARGGPLVRLRWNLRTADLALALSHAIFRIVQECLSNIVRHSQSPKAQICLYARQDCICVEARDWGVGLDLQRLPGDCVGLQGIRFRARLIGGRATISSAPGKGTLIHVELPKSPS